MFVAICQHRQIFFASIYKTYGNLNLKYSQETKSLFSMRHYTGKIWSIPYTAKLCRLGKLGSSERCQCATWGLGDCDYRPGICWMISLAPFAISQRLQPPDKLLVSVRGNGIQSPGEALSVSRSLSQIRQQGEPQLARGAATAFKKKTFQLAVYLLIEGGGADGRQFQSCICTHFLTPTH